MSEGSLQWRLVTDTGGLFVCGDCSISGHRIRALSRLPQCKAFQLLVHALGLLLKHRE